MRKYAPTPIDETILDIYRTALARRKVSSKAARRFILLHKCGNRRGAMAAIARYEGVSREAVRQSVKKCVNIISALE